MVKAWKIFLATAIITAMSLANFFTAESAPSRTLKVGYVVNTSFMEEDRPGHIVGYGYEYMEILKN